MRYMTLNLLLCIAAISLFGCGGGGGNGGNGGGGSKADQYAGTYAGSYENAGTGATGQFSFTVTNTGGISNGTIAINGSNVALTGNISNSGAALFEPAGGGQAPASGSMSAAGATTVFGALKDTSGNTIYVVALFNPAGPAAGGNSFSNDYTGTNTINATGLKGVLAIFVDGGGNITGTSLIAPSGKAEFASISGTLLSTGAIMYTFTVDGTVVATSNGVVVLSNSGLIGNVTDSLVGSVSLNLQAVN